MAAVHKNQATNSVDSGFSGLDASISQLSYFAREALRHGKGVSQRIENGTFDQRHVERAVERIHRRVFGKNMEVK